MEAAEGRQWWILTWAAVRFDLGIFVLDVNQYLPVDTGDIYNYIYHITAQLIGLHIDR